MEDYVEISGSPYLEVSAYNGYGKRKCILDNQDFLPDQEIYDGESHLASSISVVSASGKIKLQPEEELALSIIPTPDMANVPTNAIWVSSNPGVAVVSSPGIVLGVSIGEVTITATDPESGKSAEIALNVVEDSNAPDPNPEQNQNQPQNPEPQSPGQEIGPKPTTSGGEDPIPTDPGSVDVDPDPNQDQDPNEGPQGEIGGDLTVEEEEEIN